jgi:NAD(P)-dependent dehydrogenase (short-subunit alcohol dehydrogenase family)
MSNLAGRNAVIIGASEPGNMGQAIARRLREAGAAVLVSSRQSGPLAEFASEIGGIWQCCDITRRAEVYELARSARERMGRIDIAVNSTGLALGGPFLEFGEEDLDTILALQFKGAFFFLQAMVEAMTEGGSISQISSAVAGHSTTVDGGYEAYMGTKAGMDQVMRAVANQFGAKGLRVNSIAAGHTDTPMHSKAFKGDIPDWMKAAFAAEYPLGRYGTCDDIAAACVWLASDECFMTGDVLQVNGGLSLRRNPLKADLARYERDWSAGGR